MKTRIVNIENTAAARKFIAQTGADPYSVGLMAPKAVFRTVLVENADNRAANLLKQDMLSLGGEAAVSEKVSRFEKRSSKLLLMGTLRQFGLLAQKLSGQPFGLKAIAEELKLVLGNYERKDHVLKAGKFRLELGDEVCVMGILNVTPDSFSDGGSYTDPAMALARALEMQEEGAGIIDVGGESSRPGAKPLSVKEEIKRVVPVIRAAVKKLKVPVSIDTYKPEVARVAIEEGARVINDITALGSAGGRKMAMLAAASGLPLILMHMRGTPRTMQKKPVYADVISEISVFFEARAAFACRYGVKRGQLILDPGIGFGKTCEHNTEILKRLGEFKSLGLPIAVGVSRKSFIGTLLGGAPAGERLFGSVSAGLMAALNGASILRVHDVRQTKEALRVMRGITRGI